MALITTSASATRLYTPFTGLSALERAQSGVARAEVVYYGVNETWAAPGANNNRIFQIPQTTLPKDFGYVLSDVFVKVETSSAAAVKAEAVGEMRIFPGGILGPLIPLSLISDPGRATITSTPVGDIAFDQFNSMFPSSKGSIASINYALMEKPQAILYPFGAKAYTSAANPGTTFDLTMSEHFENGIEYDVSYYVRFLQYDIDQSYNYVIQSPQLTR